jgi:hypothetical protein
MSGISSSPSAPAAAAADLRVKMHRLASVFLEEVTFDDLRAVVRALVKRAVEGCFQAAKLTLAYLLGRPGSLPPAPTAGEQASRRPPAAPPAPPAAAAPAAATDSKRVVTASAPPPVVMTPEMEAFLSAPMTPDEREELRREALLLGRPPKANGGDGGSRKK